MKSFDEHLTRSTRARVTADGSGLPPEAMTIDEVQAPDARATVPFYQVVASIAALWLCSFLLSTVRSLIQDFGFQDEMLWRRCVVTLVGVG
jgi:hypothetical protein